MDAASTTITHSWTACVPVKWSSCLDTKCFTWSTSTWVGAEIAPIVLLPLAAVLVWVSVWKVWLPPLDPGAPSRRSVTLEALLPVFRQDATFVSLQYKNAKDVTRQRLFIETLEMVLSQSDKIILEGGPGGTGVVPYLPLPEIQKRTQKPATGGNP